MWYNSDYFMEEHFRIEGPSLILKLLVKHLRENIGWRFNNGNLEQMLDKLDAKGSGYILLHPRSRVIRNYYFQYPIGDFPRTLDSMEDMKELIEELEEYD